jgi:hypothetical protein
MFINLIGLARGMVTGYKSMDVRIQEMLKEAPTFTEALKILPGLGRVDQGLAARKLPQNGEGVTVVSGKDYRIYNLPTGLYLQHNLQGGWINYVPQDVFTDSVRQSGA